MAGEWIETILGKVVTLQRGFDLPQNDRQPGPYPVIASTGPVGEHSKAMVEGPGVVIGRSGSIGGGQYIESDFWPLNTTLWVKDFHGNDTKFCYYLLKSLRLDQFNVGSGVPTLNRNHIHPLPITVPKNIQEQRAIAHILGSLDDKIELNRRMNETLEGIARAIFKSWFVDFDPVRAKSQGRDPGLPKHIADLFPAEFEDSELGQIPKGWTVVSIDDVAAVTKGKSYKSSELEESDTALVTLKSILRGGGYRADGLKSFTGQYKPEQVVEQGELVVAYTDVTQAAEVIGKPALVRSDMRYNTLVASLDLGIIRPHKKGIQVPFLYNLFLTDDFQSHIYGHTNGTTVLHLSKQAIPVYNFCCPSLKVLETFNSITLPIYDLINENEHQAISLSITRDTLLPKLISGELQIKDAEKIAEQVT